MFRFIGKICCVLGIILALAGVSLWALAGEQELPCADVRDQWKIRWEMSNNRVEFLEAQLAAVFVENKKLWQRVTELETQMKGKSDAG